MAKTKFRYNPATCRYEPFYVKGKTLRNRVLLFLSVSCLLAIGGYFLTLQYIPSLETLFLEDQNQKLKIEWDILHERAEKAQEQLAEFIDKDDHNYRVILDSNPLEPSIREAGIGGSEKFDEKKIERYPIVLQGYKLIQKLRNQTDVESQSYDDLQKLLDKKMRMWAARPAIQPINNTELTYLHTTYGSRLHPVLGYVRDHKGLDFSADIGTPVYATGDGTVKMAYFSGSLGNVIFLDHKYGYETRYAHLSKFNVSEGQNVKRGDLIGFVGNTGLSHGPHLHYEVLFNGQHINPINFFQRDLSNKEYEKLIEEGSKHRLPLD